MIKRTYLLAGLVCVPLFATLAPVAEAGLAGWVALQTAAQLGQLRSGTDRRAVDNLLKRARQAMESGNLKLADWYVSRAESLHVDSGGGMFRMGGDTPQKVRAELIRLQGDQRLAQPAGANPQLPSQRYTPQSVNHPPLPPNYPTTSSSGPLPAPNPALLDQMVNTSAAQAQADLQKARAALVAGNLTAAVGYYHSVLASGARLPETGDTPAKLAQDLVRAGIDPAQLTPRAPSAANVGQNIPGPLPPEQFPLHGSYPPLNPQQSAATAAALPNPTPPYAGSPSPPNYAVSGQKADVLSLLARSRFALDRGDVDTAEQLARQAEGLQVPANQFGPGELQPDMLLMEIAREKQRRSFAEIGGRGVGPANYLQPTDEMSPAAAGQAALRGYDPLTDDSRTVPAQGFDPLDDDNYLAPPPVPTAGGPASLPADDEPQFEIPGVPGLTDDTDNQPPSITPNIPALSSPNALPGGIPNGLQPREPVALQPTGSEGEELYRRGVAALTDHNVPEARRLFSQAWKFADQMDPVTRQQLQDHLQSLSGPPQVAADEQVPAGTPLDQLTEDEQAELQQLVGEVTREQAAIRRLRETQPKQAWERMKQLREKVATANVDTESQGRLLSRIERGMSELESFIDQNRAMIELDERNRAMLAEVDRRRAQSVRTQQQLAEFVEKFNQLMDQQRFPEAILVAKQARELAPRNPVVENMIWKSQFARRMMTDINRNERFDSRAMATLQDVDDSGVPFPDSLVRQFPQDWDELSNRRLRALRDERTRFSEAELQIQQALKKPVDVQFTNEPLSNVVEQLGQMAGINVFLDPEGLNAEGVTSNTNVSLYLSKPISLRSALNLVLRPLHLSYVTQDEVLRITSEQVRDGDVYSRTYYVADLVLPIPNFAPSYDMGLPGAMREAHNTAGFGLTGGLLNQAPLTVAVNQQGTGGSATNAGALAQFGQSGMLPQASNSIGQPLGNGPGGPGGGTQADFDTLIELIQTTVEPDSWEDMGGNGAMSGFPTNLSLVVSQTQEVHEKIADLLDQLRRLQDLQVTIEVRFITLSDDFFERIGVDFDFDLDDNTGLSTVDVANLDDGGPSVTIGFDPISGAPTADLDFRFRQGSFASTIPTFGGFDPNTAANFGFAILSDIEAFFLIQAVQGDTRTNVLTAPKVTLFNGQQAFVSDTSQRPFVTSVIPVVGDFAAAHQPVITVLTEGTSLSVQAVVSQDRRFVRLTLVPFFSKIGNVDTFTFNGRTDSDSGTTDLDPADPTMTVNDNVRTITEGTTVQLPTFAFTTVNTTVSVPDGGTILLGGIKRLSEGRNERGVPVLSKLPYINRLFKNVGIGRETQSLMMMVTPRIIIQEEEEFDQTGVQAP